MSIKREKLRDDDDYWIYCCTLYMGTRRLDCNFITKAVGKTKFIDIIVNSIEGDTGGINWVRERTGIGGNSTHIKLLKKHPRLILSVKDYDSKILGKWNEKGIRI